MGRNCFDKKNKPYFPLLIILLLVLSISGCVPSSPAYPFDIFPEMHYTVAFLPEEPPRLDPPEGAVPISGRSPTINFNQAGQIRNPVPATPQNLQQAARLFGINCRACHGPEGRGNGFVAPYFKQAEMTPPSDFTSSSVQDLSDGQLYAVIENGIGGMPPFGGLLSSDDIWSLVNQVRALGQGG